MKVHRILTLLLGVIAAVGLLAYGVTEEVAIGGVGGKITMGGSRMPLPKAVVTLTPSQRDADGLRRPRVTVTDEDGGYSFRNVAAGDYLISASGKAHSLSDRYVRVTEGAAVSYDLELKPHEPRLDVYVSQRVVKPNEKPVVEVHGFLPTDQISLTLYELDLEQVRKHRSLSTVLEYFSRYQYGNVKNPKDVSRAVNSLSHAIQNRDGEGIFIDRLDLEPLPEGLYVLQVQGGGVTRSVHLNVTNIALVTKTTPTQALCYVVDIESGAPIPGARVELLADLEESARTGTTGADGRLSLTTPPRRDGQTLLFASSGKSVALSTAWSYGDDNGPARIFLYTDRSIYRPGDEVRFKGIVRNLTSDHYNVPNSGAQAQIEVSDPDGNVLESRRVTLNGFGTFNGSFTINREAMTGPHQVVATYGDTEQTLYVPVAAYRKPQYSIQVNSPKPFYIAGERATANIECQYYFGGPVPGAKVQVEVYRNPSYDFSYWYEEDEPAYEEEYYGGGELVTSLETVTGPNGIATIRFDTTLPKGEQAMTGDYRYTIMASVADDAGHYFDGRGGVKVVRGDFQLRMETDRYIVDPNQEVEVTVSAFSHEGERPLGRQEVTLQMGMEHWTSAGSVFRPVKTVTLRTDTDGKASSKFSPDGEGSMVIKALAKDGANRSIRSDSWVYVNGEPWARDDRPTLEVSLDKKTYRVAERAKVLIGSTKPGGSALLTVEADKVLMSRVIPLTGAATVVDLPVEASYAPNAYVAVAYVKGKEFFEGSRRLAIDISDRKLDVRIEPSKLKALPGETIDYRIRSLDENGKPVPAELSLSVVDESIFAIQKDQTDILNGFYPRRYNSVDTSYSFPEIFLDGGDKGPEEIDVRRNFLDTAVWMPEIKTDASGEARVQVTLPDNLTTWRATAVGASMDTHVGLARTEPSVVVNKPLTVRLQGPAFLVERDDVRLTASLGNDTERDFVANIELQADGVATTGDLRRRVRVRPGRPETIEWRLTPKESGEAKLVAKAWVDGGPSDGVEMTLSVHPHGRVYEDQDAGSFTESKELTVNVQPGADANYGRLRLRLTPSLPSALAGSLDYLVDFPYGCVEQTMSRFMPTVVVADALKDTPLKPKRAAEIPKMVAEGYSRLRKMQQSDGGWGWWEHDSSSPFMTALVLEGMYRAKQAGYPPNAHLLDRGLEAAEEHTKVAGADSRDRFYLAYVLALHGKRAEAHNALARANLPTGAADLATAVLAYHHVGDNSRRDQAFQKLMAARSESGGVVMWPSDDNAWGAEPTAVAVLAMMAASPDHPSLDKAVRRLITSRQGGQWFSTRDTSYALIALTQYLRRTPQITEPAQISIALGGLTIRTLTIEPGSPEHIVDIPMTQLRTGTNSVRLTKTGGGAAHFSSSLVQSVRQEQIGELLSESGLQVERRYYALTPRRSEDGVMRLLPGKQPATRFRAGDLIRCEITITSDRPRRYLMIEEPIPSNCRVTEREDLPMYERWSWWWSKTDVRDDHVAFFSSYVPSGSHTLSYTMRAEAPGTSRCLPVRAMNMYNPAEHGSSAGSHLEVRP
jgi:alpha-2-macroglobulin